MSFSQPTPPADWDGLLSELKTFAVTTDAWALSYDDLAGAGGVGAQIGFSKQNCFFAIGEKNSTENPISRVQSPWPTVQDARLYMSVNHSLSATNKKWWDHPDGTPNANIVTSAAGFDEAGQGVVVNDLAGEGTDFTNIWFFSDRTGGSGGSYVWVVTESGGDRYTVWGFGNLDKKGMTHPDVGFCVGIRYIWYPDATTATDASADWTDVASLNHHIGLFGDDGNPPTANAMIFLKDTTVDPALGYTDGDYQTRAVYETLIRRSGNNTANDDQGGSNEGRILNYMTSTTNQSTTGGQVLSSIPCIIENPASTFLTYVGEFPGIRLVDLTNLVPGQTIEYGAEEWLVFPFKRKGTQAALKDGASPLNTADPNSWKLGFAIKKIT